VRSMRGRQHGIARYAAKIDLIEELASGRQILHLGAVGETGSSVDQILDRSPRSFHASLTRVAERCVGIDTNREAVEALTRARIFTNLMVADATTLHRDEIPLDRLDVIVAGDIVEHLSSPGELLDNAARLADPGTLFALTTPNALGLPSFMRYLRGGVVDGGDHVLSFNRYSLENLLRRHGWIPERWATCYQIQAAERYGTVKLRLGAWVLGLWPALGGTLLVVSRRASAASSPG
jgi:SAM-dependent methyltransferase